MRVIHAVPTMQTVSKAIICSHKRNLAVLNMHHNKLVIHSVFLACFGYLSYTTHFRVRPNFCFRHQYLCSVQGEARADYLLPTGHQKIE